MYITQSLSMKFYHLIKNLFLFILVTIATVAGAQTQSLYASSKSEWAYIHIKGKLTYKTLVRGDRMIDFSYAGYRGGGIAIPSPSVEITITPVEGDNSDNIQNAVNELAKRQTKNGFKGAVLLQPGTYNCEKTITINESGIVLRGSGSGENGTIIKMTGNTHVCISIKGNVRAATVGKPTNLADAYVPSGAYSFFVGDIAGLKAGDTIRISRPVTDAWVNFMGMDQMVRDGKKQTWVTGDITTDRVITKIEKNKITVDIPLTDSYDATYLQPPGVSVIKITSSGEISQVGIENLRIVAPAQSVTINEGHHRALTMAGIADGWARNIEIFNTVNSISITGKRITVDHITITHEQPTIGAAKPADINGSGQQLLFNRCNITGDNLFFFGTGAKVTGPVVLLNCVFKGNGWIQPHQRWATGLLVDNCEVPGGGIDFMNRGSMGSGHGWAIGWAVAWNCKAKSYLNQLPPGAANWVIGSSGEKQQRAIPFNTEPFLPEGIYDSHGLPVAPLSLYLAQLTERLGKNAIRNIGYQ